MRQVGITVHGWLVAVATIVGACALLAPHASAAASNARYDGPSALAVGPHRETLYVAARDARQLVCISLPNARVTERIDMPAEPTGLVFTPDGSRLLVSCSAPRSELAVVDVASKRIVETITLGHTAMSPVASRDGRLVYVCNRFNNDVSVVDLNAAMQIARIPAVREPVAAALTDDGTTLIVANHLPYCRTDSFYMGPIASTLTFVDTRTRQTSKLELPSGSHSLRDVAISPDGRYAYVTHVLCNFELVPIQVDMGWANSNVVSVIDLKQRSLVSTVGLDDVYQGRGNPWGVGCTVEGQWLVVTHAGTHELSIVDAPATRGQLYNMFTSPMVGAIPEHPPAQARPTRRLALPGKGPRALAIVGGTAYVAEYFSDSIAVVDLFDPESKPNRIDLRPGAELDQVRRGELLFNDAMICYQNWQSCASCHPDGRADVLNWDLMNDGSGNFKNTKSLILAHRTPPSMAEGVRETAEEAVRAGLEHILFANRPEEEAKAIDAYVRSLRPVASPYLVDGKLSASAERGRRLFESQRVGCFRCHPAPWYTDRKMHDVGTRGPYGYSDRFDTPTLVEAWRTSPYLHDGRYLTVKELLVEGKHGQKPAGAVGLSESEIGDLVEFVLSL